MNTAEYTVTGMTCGNCEKHIREEVEQVAGIEGIEVSREAGRLVVTSAGAIDDAAVLAAVEEAGYSAVRAA